VSTDDRRIDFEGRDGCHERDEKVKKETQEKAKEDDHVG
jgi:hypothetical protein